VPQFHYNDIVRVKPGITIWTDIPIWRTSVARVGERAWVFMILEDRTHTPLLQFPAGTIYGIEFEGGDAIEVHESDLELVEAAAPVRQ
jgi:hypothetical protein